MTAMRPWSAFFAVITALIIATMALPDAFGFVRVAQWGGMYTDGWCQGTIRTVSNDDPPVTTDIPVTVGNDPPIQLVWYAPQFTLDTCREWLRGKCGKQWGGVPVTETFAMFRQQWIDGGVDLCTTVPPSRWFP